MDAKAVLKRYWGIQPWLYVGDEGQRYEVIGIERDTGEEHVLGWTNLADGGGLAELAKLHPNYGNYKVIDRGRP